MEKQLNPESAKLISEFVEREKICVMLNFSEETRCSLLLDGESRETTILFIGFKIANDLESLRFLFGEIEEQIQCGLLKFSKTGGDPVDYHCFGGADFDNPTDSN